MTEILPDLLKALQAKDLEIATSFVEFCKKNDLLCYFCGGGCIGAVRHKGFIPWDDDLDFFMPRDDYEKLKLLWNNEDNSPFHISFPTRDYNDHNIFVTIRDASTTMVKPYQLGIKGVVHGVSIDIFPIDGCPSGRLGRKKQLFWALVYQLFCAQLVPENHGGVVRFAAKLLFSVFRSAGVRYKIWRAAEKRMSKYPISECSYITELCAGPKYMKNEYPAQLFESAVYMDFENTKMPIPIGYDKYLCMAFGDYMQLPPEEDRIPSHDAIEIDLNKPYC